MRFARFPKPYLVGWMLSRSFISALPTLGSDKPSLNPCDLKYPNPDGSWKHTCTARLLDSDGTYPVGVINTDCASFCETSRRFFWGREVRLDFQDNWVDPKVKQNTTALENFVFTWDAVVLDVTAKIDFPLQVLGEGLELGTLDTHAIYEYSRDNQKLLNRPGDIEPWCGYWTFVPIYTESCGTISQFPKADIFDSDGNGTYVCALEQPSSNHVNQCITWPHLKPNGNPDGHMFIVEVYCDDRNALAPWEEQDPVYRIPGIADVSSKTIEHKDDIV